MSSDLTTYGKFFALPHAYVVRYLVVHYTIVLINPVGTLEIPIEGWHLPTILCFATNTSTTFPSATFTYIIRVCICASHELCTSMISSQDAAERALRAMLLRSSTRDSFDANDTYRSSKPKPWGLSHRLIAWPSSRTYTIPPSMHQ